MKWLIYIILSISCYGQGKEFTFHDIAFLDQSTNLPVAGGAFNPTNISGYPANAWYVVDNDLGTSTTNCYFTNGIVTSLLDSGPNGWHLTNSSAGGGIRPVRQISALNGYDTLLFSIANSTVLRSVNYTSSQPHEVVMLMRYDGPTNSTISYIFDCGVGTTYRQRVLMNGVTANSGLFAYNAGTAKEMGPITTNKWIVWDWLFNGATSSNWFNNVLDKSGNLGANTISGLTIGSSVNAANPTPIDIAEVVTFSTNLTTSVRTDLYNYLTNKYAIAP